MALSIEELRAKIKSEQAHSAARTSSSIFSFANLKPGDTVKIRFIDDGENNDWFWRTHCSRALKFDSIKLINGSVVQNPTYVSVPAFNRKPGEDKAHENDYSLPTEYVYQSKDDVINTRIKPLWDDTTEGRALYNKFGRNVKRIFQGFIRSEGYENKLYRFLINKDLFKIIYSFVDDEEITATPTNPINGREFILKVTEKTVSINGRSVAVKDYSSSKWANKESPLTEEETEWLEANHPFILKEFIPSRPSIEQEKIMLEMFDASYAGEPYDVAKWGRIFKPDNVQFDDNGNIKDMKNGGTMTASTVIPQSSVAQTVVQTVSQPVVQPAAETVVPTVSETVAQPIVSSPFGNMTQEQVMSMLAQMQAQTAPQTPVQAVSETVSQPNVSQLIKEHTEEVSGQNPNELISNIMGKFNLGR